MFKIPDSSGKPHLELKCLVDTTLLSLLREFVCSVARQLKFSEEEIAEIEISVDEACANAMEHAYLDDSCATPAVHVELFLSPDKLTIRISDSGRGAHEFDEGMSLDSYLDINRKKFRGLGMVLMRQFMDEVQIEASSENGTVVKMTKVKNAP